MSKPKSSPEPSPIEVRQLTATEIDRGISKLRGRIEAVKGLRDSGGGYEDGRIEVLGSAIEDTVRQVFGLESPEYLEYLGHPFHFVRTIAWLEGFISRLEERREDLGHGHSPAIRSTATVTDTRRIFVVHGHDEAAKEAVARFLGKLELEPIILHEQPNQGRTVIEKFEQNADVSFAVVLLTPDDVCQSADGSADAPQPRARQNVIFELGFFMGWLGRSRVCALHKAGVEILSDYDGVIYVPMDDPGAWKLSLAREIKAAGIEVDMNQAV